MHLVALRNAFATRVAVSVSATGLWDTQRHLAAEFLAKMGPGRLMSQEAGWDAAGDAALDLYGQVQRTLGEGSFGCVMSAELAPEHPFFAEFGGAAAVKVQLGKSEGGADVENWRGEAHATRLLHDAARLAGATPFVVRTGQAYLVDLRATWTKTKVRDLLKGCKKLKMQRGHDVAGIIEVELFDVGAPTVTYDVEEGRRRSPADTQRKIAALGLDDAPTVRAWIFQMTHALAAAFLVGGMILNDIKPENVLVRSRRQASDDELVVVRGAEEGEEELVFDLRAVPRIAALSDLGLAVRTSGPFRRGKFPVGTTLVNSYKWGTPQYTDPVALTFYDTSKTQLANERVFGGKWARGLGADVWALGLTFLNFLVRTWDAAGAGVVEALIDQWASDEGAGDILYTYSHGPFFDFLEGGIMKAVGNADDVQAIEVLVFANSMLLHHALFGEWPGVPAGRPRGVPETGGQYFAYIVDRGDEFLGRAREWTGVRGRRAPRDTIFDHFVQHAERTNPDAIDYVRRCLAWDPHARADFLLSGEAFRHAAFREFAVEAKRRPAATNAYFLDLRS
jgi:serine/threonine protein kinase